MTKSNGNGNGNGNEQLRCAVWSSQALFFISSNYRCTVTQQKKILRNVQWKRPRTWNIVGNESFNHVSHSLCAVHRFWVICWSIWRNLCGDFTWSTNMAVCNQRKTPGLNFAMKALTFRSWDKISVYHDASQTAEINRDRHFFQPNSFVSWCYARRQFRNSKCCIFETKDVKELETWKKIYFLVIFNLRRPLDDVTVKTIYCFLSCLEWGPVDGPAWGSMFCIVPVQDVLKSISLQLHAQAVVKLPQA